MKGSPLTVFTSIFSLGSLSGMFHGYFDGLSFELILFLMVTFLSQAFYKRWEVAPV